MSESTKLRPLREWVILVVAVFVVGVAVGLWIGHWENRVRQQAAEALSEGTFMEVMSEDFHQIDHYWDSKPEVARALLERQLRAHERLLQWERQSKVSPTVLTDDNILKDMAIIHLKVASLCRRLNQPESFSEHVNKAMELMHLSSNQVYAAMAKFEEVESKQATNEQARPTN